MKAEFRILKDGTRIRVALTRDSVCAGDDWSGPHDTVVEAHSFLDPDVFARELSSGYLPSVAGFGHKWICVLNGKAIAEITTSGIRALVQDSPFAEENRAHFSYHSAEY
ncbi:MAG: hypothetical protein ACKOC4_01305 [Planctomycetia bacterium]